MSISFEVLGLPGQDNALLARVDSGQSVARLLFDCGDGCLDTVPFAELLAIDHLFLSHLHMDHISGFDGFFRCLFDRTTKPNHIWGPVGTADILHHRFRGFLWNLHAEMSGTWFVHDVSASKVVTSRFELSEAFAHKHAAGEHGIGGELIDLGACTVAAHVMNHGTPTLAYVVREKTKSNVEPGRLAAMGLRPGPWLKQLKDEGDASEAIVIDGVPHSKASLRAALVTETPGESIAYLTDFILDQSAFASLSSAIEGCRTVICEAQYRNADLDLALKHHHMTTGLVADLARESNIQQLVLFHLSSRYTVEVWREMLEEVRAVFPRANFPEGWNMTG